MRLHGVRVLGAAGLSQPQTVDLHAALEAERDATGLILSTGWMDLHAHLRDPGFLNRETLESGSRSAAAGGFTQIVAMANTDPVTDRPARLADLVARAARLPVRVSFVGAFTQALEGQVLTDAAALKAAGAIALSDDGRHAIDRATLTRGLRSAAAAGVPVLVHAQMESLGQDPSAEIAATREACQALVDAPGARLHIQHVSTRGAVDLIRDARASGMALTAEVTPHHLALTADEVSRRGADARVSPPLRTADDRDAVVEGLIDGVIDVVATDHAPHDAAAKAGGANGFHGFETAAAVLLGLRLPWPVIHRALVTRPREILGVAAADDWIVIDPKEEWVVDPEDFYSRGKNTPFAADRLKGRVVMTLCRGRVVHESEVPVG
jgi:dihydroorotase